MRDCAIHPTGQPPRNRLHTAPATTVGRAPAKGAGPVLVFEPDGDVRDLLAFALERAGFTAVVASEGQEPPPPDGLIAIVSGLPGGHRGLRRLRELDGFRPLPVIDIVKPFSPSELVARVHAHVGGERPMTRSDSRAGEVTQPVASTQPWDAPGSPAPGAYHSAPLPARGWRSCVRTPAPLAQRSWWGRLIRLLPGVDPRTCSE